MVLKIFGEENMPMYNAKTVVVDGVTLIENGMILLPKEINWSTIDFLALTLGVGNRRIIFSDKEALELVHKGIYRLPRLQTVAMWVADKSEDFVSTQENKELIQRARWRKYKFLDIFEERYCEKNLIEHILRFKGVSKDDHGCSINNGIFDRMIAGDVLVMISTIMEMTEYDLSNCYVEEYEEAI